MRGVYISRPTQSCYTIVWDVKVVLDYFRQWKDNKELSLKELSKNYYFSSFSISTEGAKRGCNLCTS